MAYNNKYVSPLSRPVTQRVTRVLQVWHFTSQSPVTVILISDFRADGRLDSAGSGDIGYIPPVSVKVLNWFRFKTKARKTFGLSCCCGWGWLEGILVMWLDPGLAPTFLPWSGLILFSHWLMSLRLGFWLVRRLQCQGRVGPQATHTAALRRINQAWDARWGEVMPSWFNALQIFGRAGHFLSEIEDDRDNRWGWILNSLVPQLSPAPWRQLQDYPTTSSPETEGGHSRMLYIYQGNSAQCSPHFKISKWNVPVFVCGTLQSPTIPVMPPHVSRPRLMEICHQCHMPHMNKRTVLDVAMSGMTKIQRPTIPDPSNTK